MCIRDRDYTSVLLFLTLTAVLGLLAGECADSDLLDLAAAGGCGVLLWGNLVEEAQMLCAQMESWRSFLLGFLPVYAGVLTMGGEAAAGSAASGTPVSYTHLDVYKRQLLQWATTLSACSSRASTTASSA